MIHNIIIQPVNPMRMTKLTRIYTMGNKLMLVTPDFDFHEYDNSKYVTSTNSKNPESYPIAFTEDILFTITSFKPSSTLAGGDSRQSGASSIPIYKFSYETQDNNGIEEGISFDDKKKKLAHEVFFNQHPMTLINGRTHKNTKTPLFNVVDYAKKDMEDENIFDVKLAVANRINEMEYEEKCDVAYYFGKSPKGLTDGQLKTMLADFNSGVCVDSKIEPGRAYSNVDMFKKVFLSKTIDADTLMRITLEKAVALSVITNNKKNGLDSFYLGTTSLGNTVEDMIVHFKKEDKMYEEFIVSSVKKNTDNSKEKEDSILSKKSLDKEVIGQYSEIDIKNMRDEAKKMKEDGWIEKTFPHHIAKVPTLIAKIAEGNKKKSEKESVV